MPETEFPETPERAEFESARLALPLLPLTTGVVLPQMVVTLAVESAEARDAAADALAGVDDPGALADTAGWSPDLSVERKVELLEELDPEARLEKALAWARETLAELDLSEQIRSRVTEGMDKTQREFLLRQQLH